MKSFFIRIKAFLFRHKFISFIAIILIIYGGYMVYGNMTKTSAETRYVLAKATKGTLVMSVTGTGQVSPLTEISIVPKVSGTVTSVVAHEGQYLNTGAVIARLDTTDAEKSVRDAQLSLDSAQLALQQFEQSSGNMGTLIENAATDISNAFLDLPTLVTDAQNAIYGYTINPGVQSNINFYLDFVGANHPTEYSQVSVFTDAALSDYQKLITDYTNTFLLYKNTGRFSDATTVTSLLDQTLQITKELAQTEKDEKNLFDFLDQFSTDYNRSLPTIVKTYETNVRTDIGTTNTHFDTLTADGQALENAPLALKSQQLAVEKAQNSLTDAKTNLSYYTITAQVPGVITNITVSKGGSASGSIATLIASQKIAEISLNEVDAAKVVLGDQATLTFDAIPNLTITGKVTEIDTVGTVTQGVVNYGVKIAFDTGDSEVKAGMSVSAAIITDTYQDVIVVPVSAVKTQNNVSYVETFDGLSNPTLGGTGITSSVAPREIQVTVGASNDTMTEITSGLNEGDIVISRTISSTATPATQSSGGFRFPGLGGGGR